MSQRGNRNPNWRGGRVRGGEGKRYWLIYAPEHPNASAQGYVLEHRLIAERKLGRHLLTSEIVHHIDSDPENNHPDNLEVLTQAEHAALHHSGPNGFGGKRYVRPKFVVEHTCPGCGKAFTTHTKQAASRVCCSRRCANRRTAQSRRKEVA